MARKAVVPTDKKEENASVSLDEVEAANAQQKAREAKRDTKLTEDLMYGKGAYKRTATDTMAERDMRYARLHTFGGKTNAEMIWDFHPEAIEKQLFKIRIGNQEAILSAVEIQKYLRWV